MLGSVCPCVSPSYVTSHNLDWLNELAWQPQKIYKLYINMLSLGARFRKHPETVIAALAALVLQRAWLVNAKDGKRSKDQPSPRHSPYIECSSHLPGCRVNCSYFVETMEFLDLLYALKQARKNPGACSNRQNLEQVARFLWKRPSLGLPVQRVSQRKTCQSHRLFGSQKCTWHVWYTDMPTIRLFEAFLGLD